MLNVALFAVPAPGQCIRGEEQYLGTVRTHMHKAPLTALAAWVRETANVRIVDMQTRDRQATRYGEIEFEGMVLEKYRLGCPFEAVDDEIRDSDIVGINANFTHSRLIAADFARHAKRRNPRCTVIVGGTDAAGDPEYFLRNGADIVVKGEGELVFRELIESLDRGSGLAAVPSIVYQDGGSFVHNQDTFLRERLDVDSLPPPDLDGVDLATYTDTGEGRPPFGLHGPFISVETSRGCAQACTFCATPFTKGRYRYMSLPRIEEHFKYFRSRGINTLLFQEDNLLSRIHRRPNGDYLYPDGREELLAMFRLARDLGFSWEFTNGLEFGQYEHRGRIDHELIDAMFWRDLGGDAVRGCYRATIPLENLTDDSSRLFRKLKPLSRAKEVILALAETGIHSLTFNLIIGRPEDDEEVLRLSFDRCLEVREAVEAAARGTTAYFNVYNLSLLPGTVDYRHHRNLLAFDLERDPEVITFYLGCLRTPHFSPLEITQARGSLAKILNGDRMIHDYDENYYITSPRFLKLFS
ncbi:MAG TPA: radical SAM protein [Thermoanaerobaculia bacterium]